MQYKIFIANLTNLERMKADIVRLKSKLEDLEYIESGVKGISYDKQPMGHNPSFAAIKRLDLVDKVDNLYRDINFLEMCVDQVESILSRMPEELADALKEIYIKGKTFRRVGMDHGYSDHGYWQYLKRETEKYL